MNIAKPLFLAAALTLTAGSVAEEFVSEAQVIETQAITSTRTIDVLPSACRTGRPESDQLTDVLMWDLTCTGETVVEEVAYRVVYEFEGEQFVTMMNADPGATIPIRVQLR